MDESSRRRPGALLFVTFLMVYGLTSSGHLYLADGWSVLETARRCLSSGAFDIPFAPDRGGAFGPDGRFYSQYGLGAVLLAMPAAAAGDVLAGSAAPGSARKALESLPYSLMNVLWCAAIIGVFHDVIRRFTSSRAAREASLLLGATSLLWPYARFDFQEPAVALALLLSFRSAHHRPSSSLQDLVAGIFAGTAILVKLPYLLALPGIYWLLIVTRGDTPPGPRFRPLFFVGPAAALALVAAYNHARFGSILQSGYSSEVQLHSIPVWIGLYGLLFSAGKGVFWFCPVLGTPFLSRCPGASRLATEARAVTAITVPFILFIASRQNWDGDFALGPRYLVPFLPLFYLLVVPWVEEAARGRRLLLDLLALAGLLVQGSGILVDPNDHIRFLAGEKARLGDYLAREPDRIHVPFHIHHFNPDLGPIRGHSFLFHAWLCRRLGRPAPELVLPSTIEEANDPGGHRIVPPQSFPAPPGLGEPDLLIARGLASSSVPVKLLTLGFLSVALVVVIRGRRLARLWIRLYASEEPKET